MLAERVKEWTEQWKQDGLQEGRQEGKAEVLQCLLEMKFGGSLSDEALGRLRAADAATLQRWSTRIFSASTVDEVPAP